MIDPVVLPNAMSVPTHLVQRHLYFLRILSLASRILTVIASYSFAKLPLFDPSPNITSNSSPLLRWDAFHFTHIAQEGYVYDYEWAFFPGTPIVMHLPGVIIHCLKNAELGPLGRDGFLQGGALAALTVDSTTTLYLSTLHHFKSHNIALVVSALSLMPSSPAVAIASMPLNASKNATTIMYMVISANPIIASVNANLEPCSL